MAVADRCQETTTTTGTGTLTLLGAATQHQSIVAGIGTGVSSEFAIVSQGGTDWEIFTGTLTNSTTLTRAATLSSSNANNPVNFSAGTKVVFSTIAAAKFDGKADLSGATFTGAVNTTVHTEAAHATTSDIWTGGNTCLLSGSVVTFTDVANAPAAGAVREVIANAAHIITDNAALEVDGNANYTCAVGDLLRFEAKTTSTFRVSVVAHGDGGGSGDAKTANPLSQFAATTSAQLAGVISNETGSGLLVFNDSPTLITPALGTPASGVATNLTGTAASLTSGNVTTNANLTGHVTSSGNAAVLGSFTSAQLKAALTNETGSGAAVFAESPTLVTPALGTPASGVGTNITGTAAGLTSGNVTTNANLTGHVTSSGNAAVLGSFTSAQLATALTNETGSGAACFATAPTIVGLTATGDITMTGKSVNEAVHTEAAHATTSDIWTGGNTCLLSGSVVTFTDVADAPQAGAVRHVVANAAHVITDNSALEVDGNANYTCAVGDLLRFEAKTTSAFRVSVVAHGDGAGSGDAKTANPLSQFAATSSAQLKGVISDETGSGALAFATSPTLVTPALGTPASGVATNLTGTAASLTAGNVTTNANLTGHITSSGNAAVLGSFTSAQLKTALTNETGSGVAVFATSPTLVTPVLGTPASGVATNLTGTAAGLTSGNVTTNANLTGHITSTGNAAVLGRFTSAQLATALTNETGSGAAVFGTSPTFTGTVNAAALNTSGAVVFNDAGADVDFRVEGDTNANLLVVDASADAVGIGTDAPETYLHVFKDSSGASTDGSAVAHFESSGSTVLQVSAGTSNDCHIAFGDSGNQNIGSIAYLNNGNHMVFRADNGEKMRLTSGGDLTLSSGAVNATVHTEAAHATTSDIWTGGNTCLLSGSVVTFTDVADAPQAGAIRFVIANAAHVLTDNAALELDGNANYTCAANDVLMFTAKTTSTFRVNVIAHGDTATGGGGGENGYLENSATVSETAAFDSGNNAISAGPVAVATGVTLTIPTGSRWVIV